MKTKEITADQAYSAAKDLPANLLKNPKYKRRYNRCWKAIMKRIDKASKEGRTCINYRVALPYDPLPQTVLRIIAKELAVKLLDLGYHAHNNGNDTMLYIDWSVNRDKKRELRRLAYEDET